MSSKNDNLQKKNSKLMKIKNTIFKEKFFLGKKGFVINKSFIDEDKIEEIKKELHVTPFTNNDFGAPEEPFKVFRENSTHLYVPKFFGIENFEIPKNDISPKGKNINLEFKLNLKKEQELPAKKVMDAYHEKGGGILSLIPGFGKTIMGLYFICQLKKKTLVIVHKEFLMNQWIERIQFAIPEAKIGIIQGPRCEIEGNDIIIGMLQTLSMKDFGKDTFDDIGHVIIDECHRIPSRVFMKALFKINCKYMLGLSATPNRKDGCTKILKWFIGDIVYNGKSSQKNIVKVDRYMIYSEDEVYNQEKFNFRGQVQSPTMINQIANYRPRTQMVVEKIKKELLMHETRQFLVLSDRKQQLFDFEKLLKENGVESVGYYIGGMKQKDLKISETKKVLLGTYPMANEGLDIPSLNGLILGTPKSDIIQTVGRICRVKHENIQPLIIDVVDKFSIFDNQSKKRFKLYKQYKYEIEDIKYDMDKNEIFERKKYDYHHSFNTSPDEEVIDLNDKKKTEKPILTKKEKYDDLFKSLDIFN